MYQYLVTYTMGLLEGLCKMDGRVSCFLSSEHGVSQAITARGETMCSPSLSEDCCVALESPTGLGDLLAPSKEEQNMTMYSYRMAAR